jgi:hypothetical protein
MHFISGLFAETPIVRIFPLGNSFMHRCLDCPRTILKDYMVRILTKEFQNKIVNRFMLESYLAKQVMFGNLVFILEPHYFFGK